MLLKRPHARWRGVCRAGAAGHVARVGDGGIRDGVRMPYVVGEQGDIAAVLFGYPMSAPPAASRNNKILWVSGLPVTPGKPLTIVGRIDGTGAPVSRTVQGGPGPSIIDRPSAGCRHLTLNWSSHTDTLALWYGKPG